MLPSTNQTLINEVVSRDNLCQCNKTEIDTHKAIVITIVLIPIFGSRFCPQLQNTSCCGPHGSTRKPTRSFRSKAQAFYDTVIDLNHFVFFVGKFYSFVYLRS